MLILEILGSVVGCDVERRSGLWFVDLGCGSGNVTIAARLFGLNVIAIDQSAYALAIAKKRIFGSDEECWTLAFTETMQFAPRKAARAVVEAYVQPAPGPPVLTITAPAFNTGTPLADAYMFEDEQELPVLQELHGGENDEPDNTLGATLVDGGQDGDQQLALTSQLAGDGDQQQDDANALQTSPAPPLRKSTRQGQGTIGDWATPPKMAPNK
jgi:hypothetical protein